MAKPSAKHAGNPVLVKLGIAIRAIRARQDISQEGLANRALLDRSYMGGIERGEHNLTIINLIKIADQLGVAPSEILRKAGL
ncbi:helix-turn-helix domain-containing protein [Nitrosovibrio sp. Nv17]|uniref:helix-turn-helix domain-containing protein n=1 Tax=Nitrosovibrio sp. Nv17 TaxID=1855339 RepID=UPI0009315A6F|nr:helix-turn-helix transcriptional regulator [Nitrosovibrio sp. Nv17]